MDDEVGKYNYLQGEFSAQVWAKAWCEVAAGLTTEGQSLIDEGWMIGWFANAIMAGYDSAINRYGLVRPADLSCVDVGLITSLQHLFDEYGPRGVQETVAAMCKETSHA